jgi:hypothetical protein
VGIKVSPLPENHFTELKVFLQNLPFWMWESGAGEEWGQGKQGEQGEQGEQAKQAKQGKQGGKLLTPNF